MIEDYLLQARKPARYIGEEWNVSKKDFSRAEIKFALCFPDLYEVGMSNLGLRIIYGILNNLPKVVCERFFAPAQDWENILRSNNLEITSLESKQGLKAFDFVGFSLGYELSYTNVLNILDLGGIPLKASLRDHKFPLVIGGGPSVLNPAPGHAFFDLFFIGEAEEAIKEIVDLYEKFKIEFKSGEISKEELLIKFSAIAGVYVPSLYEVNYTEAGQIKEFSPRFPQAPKKIKKRIVEDFNQAYFPCAWIVPFIEIVHDRITLEIMRGCPNTCRFCQARQLYYPFRVKKVDKLMELAETTYKNTGYEEISLAGLSVSDYPFLEDLLGKLITRFKEDAVSISLPSIKPKILLGNLAALIATIKKTSLTFAPEVASDKLRRVINKDFDLAVFTTALKQAYSAGYQRVKLYFLIGLPFEDNSDLDAILEFTKNVSELRRELNLGPAQVNISINTLIPKPHTSFQWLAMLGLEEIKSRENYLKSKLKNKRIKLNFHYPEMSFLEGVISRGDRRLSEVIEGAFKKGCRFDAWDEHFAFQKWLEAFAEAKLDPQVYLQEKSKDSILPWDFIEPGISKELLLQDVPETY